MHMVSRSPRIRCRQIGDDDVGAVVDLLTRGFPQRGRSFWTHALEQLRKRDHPADLPKYGYLLEADGAPVGTILLICAALRAGEGMAPRCNLSSWYVEPDYRAYASLLVMQALRHKDVTYLNVSPARHTWPIIEAQGFSRYCDGIFVAFPALDGWSSGGAKADVFDARRNPPVRFDLFEADMLARHAEFGCISLWCVSGGDAFPFVFRPRLVKGVVPCVQLIYCRDVALFTRFAGPLGRYLLRRGRPVVIIDANGPIAGLTGLFRPGSMPKYYKGPQRPRLGDLAYTEYAVLGV